LLAFAQENGRIERAGERVSITPSLTPSFASHWLSAAAAVDHFQRGELLGGQTGRKPSAGQPGSQVPPLKRASCSRSAPIFSATWSTATRTGNNRPSIRIAIPQSPRIA